MDATAITTAIQEIRERLAEIKETRETIPADAFARRAELLDEEHQLEARLGELRDQAAQAGTGIAEVGAASQADVTRTPRLPES